MGGAYEYSDTSEDLSGPAAELAIIANLLDRQLERIDELFRDGNIEENTYTQLTLALINKINIISVEEVMPTDANLNKKVVEEDPLAQL